MSTTGTSTGSRTRSRGERPPEASRHLSVPIDRDAGEVYAYAADPAHLPAWASGLATTLERRGEEWVIQMPDGPAVLEMEPQNRLGVLDHYVTLPSGERFYNPMRVLALGSGCEVVFTLRRQDGMSDEAYERDASTVLGDLERLRTLLEVAGS